MILNGRNSNFVLRLPVGFIPAKVAQRYEGYANSVNYPYLDVSHMIESTLQGVIIPGLTMDTVQQTRQQSLQTYKGSRPVNAGYDKTLTLTFKLIDGYINWSCLHEAIDYYTQIFEPGQPVYWKDLQLYSLDRFGTIINVFTYNRIVFTGLEGLNPSYSNVSPDFQTFTMTFTYNIFDLEFKPVIAKASDILRSPYVPSVPAPVVSINSFTPQQIVSSYNQISDVKDILLQGILSLDDNTRYSKFSVLLRGEQQITVDSTINISTVNVYINGVRQITPDYIVRDTILTVPASLGLEQGDELEITYDVL